MPVVRRSGETQNEQNTGFLSPNTNCMIKLNKNATIVTENIYYVDCEKNQKPKCYNLSVNKACLASVFTV